MEKTLWQVYFAMQKYFFPGIEKEAYDALINNSKILEQDQGVLKVVETADQVIVKLFRLKRLFSTAYFYPYALRFKRNADVLKKKGISTVSVDKIVYSKAYLRHLLTYKKILGQSVKEKFNKGVDQELMEKVIELIANLHSKGIYFRSLHFDNILVEEGSGELVLIDISDIKSYPWPLSIGHRIRNWKHLLRYKFEREMVVQYGWASFFAKYAKYSGLSDEQEKRIVIALDQ